MVQRGGGEDHGAPFKNDLVEYRLEELSKKLDEMSRQLAASIDRQERSDRESRDRYDREIAEVKTELDRRMEPFEKDFPALKFTNGIAKWAAAAIATILLGMLIVAAEARLTTPVYVPLPQSKAYQNVSR